MKNVFTSLTAVLLVIWYSLSVIGFDVHTCRASGESYIATVISGTACEDIHPEHDVRECSCCHHKHHENDEENTLSTKPCCSDDWHMIVLTGVRTSESQDDSDLCHGGFCQCVLEYSPAEIHSRTGDQDILTFYKPDSGDFVPLDFQRTYSVWRI